MEGFKLMQAALESRRRKFGSDHPLTLILLTATAMLYEWSERPAEAIVYWKEALVRHEAVLGPGHPSTRAARDAVQRLESAPAPAPAAEPKPGRANAPSLGNYDPRLAQANVFYAEALVERSSAGSFFVPMLGEGFYFGLQEGGSGYSKHVHFSVWDPVGEAVDLGPGVKAKRFDGEGTGWATYYPFEWKTNVAYGFWMGASPAGPNQTLYTACFFDPECGAWRRLATIPRAVRLDGLRYFGSFVEDFGARHWAARSFRVGNQWAFVDRKQWLDLTEATFNCSLGEGNTNAFNAAAAGGWFQLETGGATARQNPVGKVLARLPGKRPAVLPEVPARREGN
jgi:hypothetical protein